MSASLVTYWRTMASGAECSTGARLLALSLAPLAACYALVQRIRAALYRCGVFSSRRLPRPVISVGNLTVGGTGKTPVTAYIAGHLMAQGYRVAVLSRGYGGSLAGRTAVVSDGSQLLLSARECGDEPYLLATTIAGLAVVVGSDRYAAGQLAMERLNPDLFLLDDGFQHLRLERDLNIVLLDCCRPFGNGWTLPAGLLREPASALRRADLAIFTRCPETTPDLPSLPIPACRARHIISHAVPLSGGPEIAFEQLHGKRILAFAGIAEPDHFFDGLRGLGLSVVATLALPDHSAYAPDDVRRIAAAMTAGAAEIAVATEKDGVKLLGLPADVADRILLARLALHIDTPATLLDPLSKLLLK